jgi:hypothetical protein
MGHRFVFSGYFSLTSFAHFEVPVSKDQSLEFLTQFLCDLISHTCASSPPILDHPNSIW